MNTGKFPHLPFLLGNAKMKRILIISHNALSLHANNGKTLSGIFSDWDHDNLAQIYFQDEIPESNKFHKFFRIRDVDVIKGFFNKEQVGAEIKALPETQLHHIEKFTFKNNLIGFLKKFETAKIFIRERLYKYGLWRSKKLFNWLDDFNPDVIILLPCNYEFIYDISKEIAKKYNSKHFIYFTDDFLINKNTSTRYKKKAREVIEFSDGCFAISEAMQREYRSIFNKKINILINPISFEKKIKLNYLLPTKKIIFLYAGGLTLGRLDALLKLFNFLSKTCLDKGISPIFDLCSGDSISKQQNIILRKLNINFLGKLNKEDVENKISNADFLIHVEGSEFYIKEKTKFSISTKIPECLSSGKPLIAYGPDDIASMKLIYENELGLFLNSQDTDQDIILKITDFIFDEQAVSNSISNGFYYAKQNFSIKKIQENLIDMIEG